MPAFEIYYKPLDPTLNSAFVYDHCEGQCLVGINDRGNNRLVAAPLYVWQNVVDRITGTLALIGSRMTFGIDSCGLNVSTRPRNPKDPYCFERVTFSQASAKLPRAMQQVTIASAVNLIDLSAGNYRRFVEDLKFAAKLFKVLIQTRPPQFDDTNTIMQGFTMVFFKGDLRIDVVLDWRRQEEPHIKLTSESSSRKIGLLQDYLHDIVRFHDNKIAGRFGFTSSQPGYGVHIVKDKAGNDILPELVVYPELSDEKANADFVSHMGVKLGPKPPRQSICFMRDEWFYFISIIDLFQDLVRDVCGRFWQ